MKIKEVEVRYGVTANLGNYESLRLDYSARVQLESDDLADTTQVMDNLRRNLRQKCDADIKKELEIRR